MPIPSPWALRADGKLAIRIAESGRLQFGWTLHGQREPGNGVVFALLLPRCPSTQMLLTLSADLVPLVDQAIVTAIPDPSPVRGKGGERSRSADVEKPRTRLWRIDLGGQNLATLRIVGSDSVHESRPLTLVREAVTYEFSPRGLQLSAELKLDVLHEPIRQIPLELDRPLSLVTARIGDVQVPWSEVDADDDESPANTLLDKVAAIADELPVLLPWRSRSRRIVLQLPEPLHGAGRVVRLGAVAPLSSSGRLPSIRPVPPGLLWQEGTATLLIQPPLELKELHFAGGRQTKVESLPPDAQAEAVTLQYFRPDADVHVVLERRPDRFTVDSGTTIEARGSSLRGVATVDVTAQVGECFSLAARVPASWIIDSVDSSPAGSVSNWSLARSGSAAFRLKMGFTRAVRTDRPLRLVVTGRWRRAPGGETLRSADLQMLSFDNVHVGRRVVALRATTPLRLQIAGDENLSRLDPEHLDTADAARLGAVSGRTILVVDDGAANATVTFTKEATKYSGEVHLDLKTTDDALTETYTLTCTPKSSEIDRLLVHFFPARSTPLEWTMLSDGDMAGQTSAEQITARKLSATAQARRGELNGEVWEVSWQRSRAQPFRLQATRTIPLGPSLPVALAQVPNAVAQTGAVEIRSMAARAWEIQNRRLRQVACPTAPRESWPEIVAKYEYDPAEQAALFASDLLPGLTIGPGRSLPDAWVWSMQVDAHWLRQGLCDDTAIWRLENTGRTRISIKIPASAVVDAAWIDGELVPNTSVGSGGLIEFTLPVGRRFPVVVFRWTCQEPPLSIVGSRFVELPEISDMRVLARRMNLWLPPNWSLVGGRLSGMHVGQSVSWSQRLFGPFGQPFCVAPFDPFDTNDWRDLAGPIVAGDATWTEATRIMDQINSATTPKTSTGVEPPTNWGQLLLAAERMIGGKTDHSAPRLLIDRQSLADVGIFSGTSIGPFTANRAQARTILDEADLVLLVAPDATLLTTRSAASRWLGAAFLTNHSGFERVPAGALRDQLRRAAAGMDSTFVPMELWCLPEPAARWSAANDHSQDTDRAGWMLYQLESVDVPGRFWILKQDAIVAAGCALFLITAVGLWWKGEARWQVNCGLLIVAAAFAMLIPDWLAPLGSGVFLGILSGWLLNWFAQGRVSHQAAPTSPSPRITGTGASLTALLVVASLAGPRMANSAEPKSMGEPPAKRPVYNVVVPVDKQDRPMGDNVFVPQPLYDELFARLARPDGKTQDGLLTSAIYHGSLARDAGETLTVSTDWTADFDLQTFVDESRILIPFGGEGAHLVPDGVRLDGRPTEFDWKNSGRSLGIVVPHSGRHELELLFRPVPQTANSATAIDLVTPRTPNARLRLDAPSDVPVEVPSAEGLVSRDEHGAVIAELGANDQLSIRAGQPAALESKPLLSAVDELLWLRIRPGSVVLDTRLTLHVAKGSLRQVQLITDPRLRRLPLEDGSPVAQVRTETAEFHTISLALARPITDEVAMKLSFLLTDTSGIGNLRLPRLDVVGTQTVNRRLAVSIESPLEADEKSLGHFKSMPVPEFRAAWGSSEVKPQFAFQLADAAANWNLAVHSRQPQLTASNLTTVFLGADRIAAAWLTDLAIEGGAVFQLQLSVPEDFAIESAVARELDATERPLQWSRGVLGEVTLFLPHTPADHYQLLVRGSKPTLSGNTMTIPDLRIAGCNLESQTMVILRQTDVTASMVDRTGLSVRSGKDAQQTLDRAVTEGLVDRVKLLDSQRLVAALVGTTNSGIPTLRVAPNSPRVDGSQRTTIERSGSGWMGAVDLDLTISGGVLDTLRFELPPQWSVAPEVIPAMSSKVVEVPGEANRRLILRPAEPLIGAQHLRLRAPIAVAAGERVRVPDVRPLGLGLVRRIVLLPTSSNEQKYYWETRGLNFEPLPASFASTSPNTEIERTCQVVGDGFEATLKSVEKTIQRPRVRLADIRLVLPDEQRGYGIASFDLDPAGGESCLLELPAEDRLLHASLNDGPAVLTQIAPNQWKVSGGAARLPQRIDIIFVVDRAADVGDPAREYHAPALIGFAVDQTLWSVATPRAGDVSSAAAEAHAISSLDAALIRIQSASAMLESAGDQLSNESSGRAARVYSTWARRLSAERAVIDRERVRLGPSSSDAAIDAAIRTVDGIQARLARNLEAQRNLEPPDRTEISDDAAAIWNSVIGQDRQWSDISVAGPGAILTIGPERSAADSLAGRILLALACSGLIAGLFWLGQRAEFHHAVARWPWLPGVFAGLAWWLWLSPSIAGWAIMAASVFHAYRFNWRRSRIQDIQPPREAAKGSSVMTSLTPTQHFQTHGD